MKNIIKINVKNPYYYTLENVGDGSNSIIIQFTNYTATGKIEIYYGDAYYTEISVDNSGSATIPPECYNDGGNLHIRYENGTITCFIHIIGDGSKYEDLILTKVSDCIAAIGGSKKETIVDYAAELAAIISTRTIATYEGCYVDLNSYRKALIALINDMGGNAPASATISDIVGYLAVLKAEQENEKALIAAAITAKGVDTSSSDSILTMINNITNIPSDGYGVSGYVDTTISAAGGIVAIYGLYTVEEQEAS